MGRRKKDGRGRPSKLTPENTEKICQALRAGNYRSVSANWAGVSLRVFNEWMRKGQETDSRSKFAVFRRTIIKAERQAEIKLVALVMKHAEGDAKHAEWLLAHRHPDRWADKARKMERLQLDINDARESKAFSGVDEKKAEAIVDAALGNIH